MKSSTVLYKHMDPNTLIAIFTGKINSNLYIESLFYYHFYNI
jgi:hypothetical protein